MHTHTVVCCKQLNPLLSLFLETLVRALSHTKHSANFPSYWEVPAVDVYWYEEPEIDILPLGSGHTDHLSLELSCLIFDTHAHTYKLMNKQDWCICVCERRGKTVHIGMQCKLGHYQIYNGSSSSFLKMFDMLFIICFHVTLEWLVWTQVQFESTLSDLI